MAQEENYSMNMNANMNPVMNSNMNANMNMSPATNSNMNANMNMSPVMSSNMNNPMDNEMSAFPPFTPVGMCYVPMQTIKTIYEPEIAHRQGTMFPDLDKPFLGGRGHAK